MSAEGPDSLSSKGPSHWICVVLQVVAQDVFSQDSPGLHNFLSSALLSPHMLGIPASEDETARRFAADARVSFLISTETLLCAPFVCSSPCRTAS